MDSDPPPSYNSVVVSDRQQLELRRRDRQAGNEPSETSALLGRRTNAYDRDTTKLHNQADSGATCKPTGNQQIGDGGDYNAAASSSTSAILTNTTSGNTNDNNSGSLITPNSNDYGGLQVQEPEQRTTSWGRFKKGLEDLALFVIQILD